MSGDVEPSLGLTVHVEPAPTPDEEAAIVAALTVLGLRRRPVGGTEPETRTGWREAARREGLRQPVKRWWLGGSTPVE